MLMLKKLKSCPGNPVRRRASRWMFATPTVPSVPFSVLRSPNAISAKDLAEDSFAISCTGCRRTELWCLYPKGTDLGAGTVTATIIFGKGLSGGKLIVYPPKGVHI